MLFTLVVADSHRKLVDLCYNSIKVRYLVARQLPETEPLSFTIAINS